VPRSEPDRQARMREGALGSMLSESHELSGLSSIIKGYHQKEGAMKKGLLCIVVLAGLLSAETVCAGMKCWTDSGGFYWKLYITTPDGISPFKTVTGVYYKPGQYIVPVTGTLQKGLGGTTLILSVTGTYVTISSSELLMYSFEAKLDPTTKDGTLWWLWKKNAESLQGPESNAGTETITKAKCSDLPPY